MKGRFLLFPLLALVLVLVTCSKDTNPTGSDGDIQPPVSLALTPLSGTPASVASITGYMVDTSRAAEIVVQVGGEAAPYYVNEDQSVTFMVPLFLDSTGWPAPPDTPVKVEILLNDSVVAVSDSGYSVLPLPHAPGTTAEIHQAAEDVVVALENLWSVLPVTDESQRVVRQAVTEMMAGPVREGDSSLAAIVNGTSSLWQGEAPDLELVDAIMASSGVLDIYTALADGLNRSRDSVAAKMGPNSNLYCRGDGADMDLACQMQIYVLLRDYTETFVIPTANTYNNTVGLVAGLASISGVGTLPGLVAEVIGALLTVESFIMDKIVVATLPSHIVTFLMTSEGDTIAVDDFTSTRLFLSAGNTPVPITVNDIVTQLLATLPFLNGQPTQEFGAVLLRAAQFVINQYRDMLQTYEATHPGTFDDIALTSIPSMVFGPVEITHDSLVQLFSEDPSVAAPAEAEMEWQGIARGQTSVRVFTRPGGIKVANDYMFLTSYTGGAFGESSAATDSRTITVGRPGALTVLIEGLPSGEDADVAVHYPDGVSSTDLTATTTLNELDAGVYTVAASEVETANDGPYVGVPASQMVEVIGDTTVTATVTYQPKYGNMYVVVTGLFEGEEGELPADIRIEGPNGFVREVSGSVLIDSLEPGTYDVFAFEVDDPFGQTYVPNPDVSEETVDGGNTTVVTIDYTPKFGTINLQVKNLPSGIDADIDIEGPNGYFHHSTATETIDSLLEGDYTVNAYEIVDNNGDTITPSPLSQTVTVTPAVEEVAWVDYSGGHDLTVSFTGLPLGAQALYSIAGPEGYGALIVSDTTLTGLPDGGPFVLTGQNIQFDGNTYRPSPKDTTIFIYADKSIDLRYKALSAISFLMGGLRSNNDQGQLLVYADSRTTTDTSITDKAFDPTRGAFPEQLSYDSCLFEGGRMVLANGLYEYQADATTAMGQATVNLSIDVKDTTATMTFDGTVRVYPPADPQSTDIGSASIRIDLSNLLQILINNPNDPSTSTSAAMGVTGRVEVMNPDAQLRGTLNWTQTQHLCRSTSNSITLFSGYAFDADTLQVFESSTGSIALSGQLKEVLENFRISLSGSTRAGETTAEATVHGSLEFILRQN